MSAWRKKRGDRPYLRFAGKLRERKKKKVKGRPQGGRKGERQHEPPALFLAEEKKKKRMCKTSLFALCLAL